MSVNVSEFRQNLPSYLKQVALGQEIVITSHGKEIARLVPEVKQNKQAQALQRLKQLEGKMLIGDVMSSSFDEWTGDAYNL